MASRESSSISANVADILIKKLRDKRAQARELRIPPPTPTKQPSVRYSPELCVELKPGNETLDAMKRKLGVIDTCFPSFQTPAPAPDGEEAVVYPETYRTLSSKEKLVLLFAENFRRQYREKFPHRQPLVLAPPNECAVQKFVSTTLRPSVLLFPDLIGSWQEIAAFVADYIVYEPLADQINMPTRLVSPDAVLKQRRANSFELATLLCSFLIGNGFAACVVSGYATREVVNNDQQRVVCPFVPVENEESGEEEQPEAPNKYQLRQPPDLRSQYLLNIEEEKVAKGQAEEANRLAAEREEIERLEQPPDDPKRGHRVHAWVAILKNAPWCYKPGYREMSVDPNTGEQVLQPPCAFFLEPSTGFRHEVSTPDYLAIESIWNQHNYYVNKQHPAAGLAAMRWDLADGRDWEHFLPGEPYELREDCAVPEDQDPLTTEEEIEKEKHLDMPTSWVRSLNVSRTDYEQRFPDGAKVIYFKKTIYERFAPYRNLIGLVRRITTYETLDYDGPICRWEFYANRDDQLNLVRIEYRTNVTEEHFDKGRPDCLRLLKHRAAPNNEYELRFFHQYRFDALRTLIYHASYIQEHYDKRDDLLYYREFHNIPKDQITKEPSKLTHINEKFHQNPSKIPVKDIAIRNCYIQDNKIALQFHYGEDCITASTREFVKPPKSEMGEEVPYDPNCTSGYVSNPWDPQPTQLDLFLMLKEQLKAEELASHAFRRRVVEIDTMLSERRKQTDSPRLTNSLFDPLRNEEARQLRLAKYEAIKAREEQIKQQQADFLAPYLLRLGDTSKRRAPTRAQVMALYRDCTADLRHFYQRLEEELRNRCDDLITEEQSLKRFLSRFQQHFEDAEYEKFIAEGETIERDKHILQMRLENIQDDYRRKAAHLRQALRADERLRPYLGAEMESPGERSDYEDE